MSSRGEGERDGVAVTMTGGDGDRRPVKRGNRRQGVPSCGGEVDELDGKLGAGLPRNDGATRDGDVVEQSDTRGGRAALEGVAETAGASTVGPVAHREGEADDAARGNVGAPAWAERPVREGPPWHFKPPVATAYPQA